jgi:glutamine amidotransferase
MAWFGQSLLLEELIFNTEHGIVDQSLHSRLGAETTNGDGFGVGWYGVGEGPGVFRSVAPAWSDSNLRHLSAHIESRLFLMHIRAAIGSPVQESNCHPFNHGRWLFVHNGYLNEFHQLRRDLMLAIDPEHFADVAGSTDTEVIFRLALTLGLDRDPVGAMERTVALIEDVAQRHGVPDPVQASFGLTDGETLWGIRYSSVHNSRSLFVSADPDTIRNLHPEIERFSRLTASDRLIVSEPFSDLPGVWEPVAESSVVTVRPGGVLETAAFDPR